MSDETEQAGVEREWESLDSGERVGSGLIEHDVADGEAPAGRIAAGLILAGAGDDVGDAVLAGSGAADAESVGFGGGGGVDGASLRAPVSDLALDDAEVAAAGVAALLPDVAVQMGVAVVAGAVELDAVLAELSGVAGVALAEDAGGSGAAVAVGAAGVDGDEVLGAVVDIEVAEVDVVAAVLSGAPLGAGADVSGSLQIDAGRSSLAGVGDRRS